jgi:hypothetical protein
MKNTKYFAIAAGFAIPAGLIWYEAKSTTRTIEPALLSPPASVIAAPLPVIVLVRVPSSQPSVVVDTIGADGVLKHIAQPGETVTSLAANILGEDTKANRDTIINANSSLRADPDKLLAGKSYHIPTPVDASATAAAVPVAPVLTPAVEKTPTPTVDSSKDLKYTAAPWDTVEKLAGAFLGNGDQAHQNAITDANPALQNNPDRLIAGKTYSIPAPAGLSAAPVEPARRPSTQPDADQIITQSSPRILRYTACAGDTVTTLAIKLLGSDTQEARDTIINNNPSLKRDPDRLIAGQTYSIPAPMAATKAP